MYVVVDLNNSRPKIVVQFRFSSSLALAWIIMPFNKYPSTLSSHWNIQFLLKTMGNTIQDSSQHKMHKM